MTGPAPCGLPLRVAQVTHALMEAWTQAGGGLVTTSEVMVYDENALTLGSTSGALFRAMSRGLVDRAGWGLWFPTSKAWELRRALEETLF